MLTIRLHNGQFALHQCDDLQVQLIVEKAHRGAGATYRNNQLHTRSNTPGQRIDGVELGSNYVRVTLNNIITLGGRFQR
jgi:hypothetical protein